MRFIECGDGVWRDVEIKSENQAWFHVKSGRKRSALPGLARLACLANLRLVFSTSKTAFPFASSTEESSFVLILFRSQKEARLQSLNKMSSAPPPGRKLPTQAPSFYTASRFDEPSSSSNQTDPTLGRQHVPLHQPFQQTDHQPKLSRSAPYPARNFSTGSRLSPSVRQSNFFAEPSSSSNQTDPTLGRQHVPLHQPFQQTDHQPKLSRQRFIPFRSSDWKSNSTQHTPSIQSDIWDFPSDTPLDVMFTLAERRIQQREHIRLQTIRTYIRGKNCDAILRMFEMWESPLLSLLWIVPSRKLISDIMDVLDHNHVAGLFSIGCGSGLLEWLIQCTCKLPVHGVELSPIKEAGDLDELGLIPMWYVDRPEFSWEAPRGFAIFQCWGRDDDVISKYAACNEDKLVIILGALNSEATNYLNRPGWVCIAHFDYSGNMQLNVYSKNVSPELMEPSTFLPLESGSSNGRPSIRNVSLYHNY